MGYWNILKNGNVLIVNLGRRIVFNQKGKNN